MFQIVVSIYLYVLPSTGSLMCCLSSLPFLDQRLDKDNQFYMALFGQMINGVARALNASLTTRISQSWFGESQRLFATGVIVTIGTLGRVGNY